jgi:hypothetical protein
MSRVFCYEIIQKVYFQRLTHKFKLGLVNGKMSKRALKMIFEWLELHKDELMEDWDLAQDRKTLLKITPLP